MVCLHAFYGKKFGLTTFRVSDRVRSVQRSRRSEARCTAALLGRTLVMSVHALDFGNSLEDYEEFMTKDWFLSQSRKTIWNQTLLRCR